MKQLHVGMVTLCYKPLYNGVVQMIDLYKERLQALGHEVTIFTLHHNPATFSEKEIVTSFGIPLGNSGYFVNAFLNSRAQHLLSQMDIVHCHHLFVALRLAHRYANGPVVYTNHTRYDLYGRSLFHLPQPIIDHIMRRAWPAACDFADCVIAPSESVRQVLLDFGVKTPVERIENGIDQRPFRNPKNRLSRHAFGIDEETAVFIYVGRLSPEKNLKTLFRQFCKVVQNHRAALLLVGDGPEMETLRQLRSHLGLEDVVTFCGAVAHTAVPNYLAAADCFVTASTSEVHPLTLIEAMSAGLPIVAIDAPGNRDVVTDGQTGLLVKKEALLSHAICQLVEDEPLRQKLARQALEQSERFTIDRTVKKTVDLYERLLLERPDLKRRRRHGRFGSHLSIVSNQ